MPFGFDAAPAPAAGAPPAAPDQKPYQPSFWDVLQGVLFDDQSPAQSAMSARQRNYQNQMMQQLPGLLATLPSGVQAAAVLGGPKVWEEVVKNYGPQTRSPGQQTDYFGGQSQKGGYTNSTDTYGVDDKSGTPIQYGPGVGFKSLGPSIGGDYSVSPSGAITSGRTGQVAGRVGVPQIVPAGSSLQDYAPSVPGMPAIGDQSPTPPQNPGAGGSLDGSAFFRSFILPHEGGLNPSDMNGSPTNFGINQAANPEVDVRKLTKGDAENIFLQKYWAKSGAANLPAPLAAVHADTYYINPRMANTFLEKSNGDANAYLDLRESWMQRLAQTNPKAAVYAGAWSKRNADLQGVIDASGGGQQQLQQGGGVPAQVTTLAQGRGNRVMSPQEAQGAGFAPGAVVVEDPTGKPSVAQSPEYGPEAKSSLRNQILTSDEYKQAQSAMSAYKAMIANAKTMTGPSAYAMLDTFARAINPGAVARPQVIETIEKNLGIPAQVVGKLDSAFGKGNLPPQVRQQIIDAVVPFAQAHWDQANHLNEANTDLARHHGFNPADVTAPLEGRPQRYSITAAEAGWPQQSDLVAGRVYNTPKGPLKWTGTGFRTAGGR